ncbi:hypothetical protein [Phyllobacterium zundukense]|jgi:hypothetical protein|uniref:Uncharacterized protein n=1 Tax=Phyllobacterium zundukense TaxID=1867719 RepID=A0ACD4D639_9HYPH|nr:hypothetical protein [Phyllobacterium zundukense]UXN61320.1 hypothetical protein N8E88_14670 [Phyllobacterium zundukense]
MPPPNTASPTLMTAGDLTATGATTSATLAQDGYHAREFVDHARSRTREGAQFVQDRRPETGDIMKNAPGVTHASLSAEPSRYCAMTC